nr:hydantoinase/oxoprolinase family protein [Spongiactinospora gelatinilytica]
MIAQGRDLERVAAVRLATPPQSLMPMIDWPYRLREVVDGGTFVCAGGAQFDGTPLNELDEAGLREIARRIAASGVRHIALSSVFSTVNPDPETRAKEILRGELPDASITRSTLVGRVGLLERENATILNAALLDLAGRVIDGLEEVVAGVGITAPILLSQNDGTVMTLDRARRFPIFTIASGPTNSMRGAALLTGLDHGVVIDVGGTTSDIGMLQHGFPRESTVAMSLAGVRSNFRMPDVLSMPLGGGTKVTDDGAVVGPESVGFRIMSEARVFGGDTLTFTDVAVASGAAPIGDATAVRGLPAATVRRALDIVTDRLTGAIDKAKLTAGDTPVIVVGGGGPLLAALPGFADVIIPEHAGVANAVGAALGRRPGEHGPEHRRPVLVRERVRAGPRGVHDAVTGGLVGGRGGGLLDAVPDGVLPDEGDLPGRGRRLGADHRGVRRHGSRRDPDREAPRRPGHRDQLQKPAVRVRHHRRGRHPEARQPEHRPLQAGHQTPGARLRPEREPRSPRLRPQAEQRRVHPDRRRGQRLRKEQRSLFLAYAATGCAS